MLREVKNKHLRPRIFNFYCTASGGNAVSFAEGSNDFTATESGAGLPVLTLRQPVGRNALVFGSCGGTSGSYVSQAAASTKSALSLQLNSSGGSATDMSFQGMVLGWEVSTTNLVKSQLVKSSERKARIFGGIITSAGVVTFGTSDISVTKVNTGNYSLTYKRAFDQKPSVVVTGSSAGTTAIAARTGSQHSQTGGTIFTYNESGTLTDAAFNIIVYGDDCRDEHGGARATIKNPQRKPFIVAGQVTGGGSPSVAIGSEDVTVVSNGAGDYTLTFVDSTLFRQTPVVIACANNSRVMIVSQSSTSVRLRMSDSSNNAADPTSVDFFCLGSGDPSEY